MKEAKSSTNRAPVNAARRRASGAAPSISGMPSLTRIAQSAPACKVKTTSISVNVAGERKDRKVHGDQHDTDHAAHTDHHDRFERTRQCRYRDVRLFFVEICDLVEHLI